MRHEVEASVEQRNRNKAKMEWRFTTEDARIKLKSLYPSIIEGQASPLTAGMQ